MKKFFLTILVVASTNSVFGMSKEREEWEKGRLLRELGWSLVRDIGEKVYSDIKPRSQDEEKDELAVVEGARQRLDAIASKVDQSVPGVTTYLDFFRLIIETDPRYACRPDQQGATPMQRLLALHMPSSEEGALNGLKERVRDNWLLCVRDSYRAQDPESQEAAEAELRYCLVNQPLPSDIIDCAAKLDLDAYRSPEGQSFYRQIESMHARREMNDKTYSFLWDPELWTKQKWKPTDEQLRTAGVVAAYLARAREAAQGDLS